MTRTCMLFAFLSLFLISSRTSAQTPAWSWAHAWSGPSYDEGNCIATDPSGNVYTAGEFFSSIVTTPGSTETLHNSGSRYDCYVMKYAATGSVIWTRNFGSALGDDIIRGIAADAAGNVYIHGNSTGSILVMDEDTLRSPGPGVGIGAFTAKLNATGEVVWARQSDMVGTTGSLTATSVAVDMNGGVICTGVFTNPTITFGTDTHTNSAANYPDIYIVKYDANGNYLWSKRYGGAPSDIVGCLTVDPANNIWFSGYFSSDTTSFGSYTFTRSITNPNPIYITKLDPDGNVVWASSGLGNAVGLAIAADPSGNIYLTGTFTVDMTLGGITLSSAGSHDFYIAKFAKDGTLVWLKRNGSPGFEKTYGIATDHNGKFYITGVFSTSTMTFGDSTISNPVSHDELFVAKYDTAGNGIWAMTAKGINGNDPPSGIATDKWGSNIYITGYTVCANLTFGSINVPTPTAPTAQDAYVGCIHVTGVPTGISDMDEQASMSIYPNPANDMLTIEGANIEQVTLMDITGKQMLHQTGHTNSASINVSALPTGLYTVKILTPKGYLTGKFIKQ